MATTFHHVDTCPPTVKLGDAHILVRQNDSGGIFSILLTLSRVILDVTLWTTRGVAMRLSELHLGRFGDRRLDKRGRRCSGAWLRARVSVCAGWRVGGDRNWLVLDDFWPIAE